MTPLQIIPKGRGRISRAIRELDARTRSLIPRDVPNALVSHSAHGVTVIPTATAGASNRGRPTPPVWG